MTEWDRAYMRSSWTGRAARDMRSAFGPYTDDTLHPMPAKQTNTERAAGVVLAVVLGILLAALLVHWAML